MNIIKRNLTPAKIIMSLLVIFMISRVVSCIDTAMPYADKMKEKEIVIDSMRFKGDICELYQHIDKNSYFFKSYGQFDIRTLDSLSGKEVSIHYLNRRGFGWGIFPRYRICRIDMDSTVIFNQIMIRGAAE